MEKILYACIVLPTGKQYSGNSHSNCYDKMMYDEDQKNYLTDECKEGFLTEKGKFVDRQEAAKIALAAGQIKEEVGQLKSYMLDLNYL